jgi:hypothetical protein
MPSFMSPLESRVHLSASPAIALDTTAIATQSAASIAPAATSQPTLTDADRRTLLSRLTPGPLTASLSKSLRYSGGAAFDATLLKYMVYRAGPKFFFNGRQLPRIMDYAKTYSLSGVAQAATRGDAILARQFPEQINSTTYTVQLPTTGEINWDAASTGATDNPDFLHTLNRHTFWKELGKAYRLTDDGKYVRELISELTSWSAQTPALADPNTWAQSSPHWWLLDAADRASNWTTAYFLVLGSPDWTPAANTLFLSRLWDHGDFLARATPSSYRTNKTAIQAQGLQRIGMMFPEFADAAAWEYRGTDITFRCLSAQFYPDGGHVEETPAYQAAAADAFLDNYRLAQLNGRTYWTKARRRILENAVQSYARLARSGLSDTYRTSNSSPFLDRAAAILSGGQTSARTLDNALTLAVDGNPIHDIGPFYPTAGPTFAMPDSGYYVLSGDSSRLIFDAGPKGGEHGHYDLLNFEFSSPTFGAMIPDPGPYRYDDSPDRAYAISTPAHNTISIDGLNHEAVEGAHNPKIVFDGLSTHAGGTDTLGSVFLDSQVTAHHHAYEYLDGRPTVGRTIWHDETPNRPFIGVVVDWGRSDPGHPHTFTTSFNLNGAASGTTAGSITDAVLTRFYNLRLQSLPVPGQTYAMHDTFVSNRPPPDAKSPARRYAITQTGANAVFVTMFTIYRTAGEFGAVPTTPATLAWAEGSPPGPGGTVRLLLTLPDGTVRTLRFPPPNLGPLPAAFPTSAAIAPPATSVAPPSSQSPVARAARPGVFAGGPALADEAWLAGGGGADL